MSLISAGSISLDSAFKEEHAWCMAWDPIYVYMPELTLLSPYANSRLQSRLQCSNRDGIHGSTVKFRRGLKVHKHEIFLLTFFAEIESLWSQGPVTRDF
jgi:hypothetical protein